MMTDLQRQAAVSEALTWLNTPWHHRARVKGAGVDCAQLLIAVYAAIGVIPLIDVGFYVSDWHLHRDRPRFLELLEKYAEPTSQPLPGTVVMFRFGRHAAHGSIVTQWPQIIHASRSMGRVALDDADRGELLERFAGFWEIKS